MKEPFAMPAPTSQNEERGMNMNLNEAVKVLDDVIPEPLNKMVDLDHLDIAIAWKVVKEHLDLGETEGDREGICPVCGGELEFEDNVQMDDGGVYPWTCPSCGSTGKQGYNEVFDGHHYDVRDACGDPIPGREE